MAVDGLNELFFWVGCRSLLLDLIPENKEDLIFLSYFRILDVKLTLLIGKRNWSIGWIN